MTIAGMTKALTATFRDSRIVAGKELREGLRDRRALGSALGYALAGPLLVGAVVGTLTRDRNEVAFTVAVAHPVQSPDLRRTLESAGLRVEPTDDAAAGVRAGRAAVGVATEEGYARDLAAMRPARVSIYADFTRGGARAQSARVKAVLARYAARITELRLIARGVAPAVASPLLLEERDTSTMQARFALALAMLPVFLMLAPFACAVPAAIDATAGERERGSLEPLLLSPVGGRAIALGKWAAVSVQSAIGVTATAAVAFLVFRTPWVGGAALGLELSTLVRILALLLPLAPLAAGVLLLAALASKSFKEAQAQATLLMLVPMVPGLLFAVGTLGARPWMNALPLLGQQLLCAEILRGEPRSTGAVFALTFLTMGAALVCMSALGRRLEQDGASLVG